MSKELNLSQQSILKLSVDLRKELLEQLESFNLSKNNYLLIELKKLFEFKNKEIINQTSNIYLEININQVEKIIDILSKLEGYNQLKNPSNNLTQKLDKIKDEIIDELIMLPAKLYAKSDINLNNDQHFTNAESNYDDKKADDKKVDDKKVDDKKADDKKADDKKAGDKKAGDKKAGDKKADDKKADDKKVDYKKADDKKVDYKKVGDKKVDQIINKAFNKSADCNKIGDNIWSIIFKELQINDLLTCRLVNKKFKHFSDHTNGINKLIIGGPFSGCDHYYWYYNYKLIEYKDIISIKCFRAIKKLSIFNLDTNLKYLKIYDQQFKLEEVSNLINLQSIEFGKSYQNNNQQILNLNNLKVFISNWFSVQLNTPNLEKILFYHIDSIRLNSNPDSIKHLITCNYDNKLEIFKKLEIMELVDVLKPEINENLLSIFKSLKQLKINLNVTENYFGERIRRSLIKILIDKIKLKRPIDIYLEDVKIENTNKILELVSIEDRNYWKFKLNNYNLLDLSFINSLPYELLERCVNNIKNDLPSSFFDKFFHINQILVWSSVKDVDGFKWFLNKLKYLNRLEIYFNVSLGQNLYNNLPNTIEYIHIDSNENINYEFILKLSKLYGLYTSIDKDLFDLVFKSFSNLKYFIFFRFTFRKKEIRIEKDGKYFYLNYNDRRIGLNYNHLREVCNKIRSNEIIF